MRRIVAPNWPKHAHTKNRTRACDLHFTPSLPKTSSITTFSTSREGEVCFFLSIQPILSSSPQSWIFRQKGRYLVLSHLVPTINQSRSHSGFAATQTSPLRAKQHQMHQTSPKSDFEIVRSTTTNGNVNRIARRKRVARTKDPTAEDWIG